MFFDHNFIFHLTLFLGATDILVLRRVSKHFKKCIDKVRVWKSLYERIHGKTIDSTNIKEIQRLIFEIKWDISSASSVLKDEKTTLKRVCRPFSSGCFPIIKSVDPLRVTRVSIKILDLKLGENYSSFGLATKVAFEMLRDTSISPGRIVGRVDGSYGYCSDYGADQCYLLSKGDKSHIKKHWMKPERVYGKDDVISLTFIENKLTFYKNGIQQGLTLTTDPGEYFVALSLSTDFYCELLC